MILHTVAFQWKPQATDAHRQRALVELRALKAQIPELLEAHVGHNFSAHGQGHELACIMKFADRPALQVYAEHPAHRKLTEWLLPLVTLIEIDLES